MAVRNTLYRDRLAVLLALIAVTALAWAYTIRMATTMAMPGMGIMPGLPEICTSDGIVSLAPAAPVDMSNPGMGNSATGHVMGRPIALVVMWVVMMIGMMLPAATSMILAFAGINQKRRQSGQRAIGTSVFVLGYLVVWSLFSIAAAGLQILLQSLSLMSHNMALAAPSLTAAVLIGAGIYQFTTWKHACLKHCRSPMSFIMNSWREGTRGAFVMGFHHGLYCLGCCWILMLVMFAVGTMNLILMAALTFYLLVEKLLPFGHFTSRLAGSVLTVAGIAAFTGHLTWS